jgi:TIR domain
MARVFICYRREDSGASAGRIQDRLERELGRDHLFIDVDGIPLGVNFVKVLHEEVARCGVLLAVIGPNWLDVRDEDGTSRRLDNPTDFVRIEIAAALQREIPVIPILLDGTKVPKADQLPEELKELALRNGLSVRHASFHADLDKLIQELKRQVGASTLIGTNTPFRAENDPSAWEPLAGGMLDPLSDSSAKNPVNAAGGALQQRAQVRRPRPQRGRDRRGAKLFLNFLLDVGLIRSVPYCHQPADQSRPGYQESGDDSNNPDEYRKRVFDHFAIMFRRLFRPFRLFNQKIGIVLHRCGIRLRRCTRGLGGSHLLAIGVDGESNQPNAA